MNIQQKDDYKASRILYIIEAALEYFVAIAVGTVYLAKITSEIGIPDNVTGILTSFVSLGCGFQIITARFINEDHPCLGTAATVVDSSPRKQGVEFGGVKIKIGRDEHSFHDWHAPTNSEKIFL